MKWSSFLVATAVVAAMSPVAALPSWAKRRPRQGRGKCTMILVGANATVDGYAYATCAMKSVATVRRQLDS